MKKTQGNDEKKSQVFHYSCHKLFFLDYFFLKYSMVNNLKRGVEFVVAIRFASIGFDILFDSLVTI